MPTKSQSLYSQWIVNIQGNVRRVFTSFLVYQNGHDLKRTSQSYSDTGTYQTQRSERQLVHIKDKMIIWAFPEDLERLHDSDHRIHVDGTFRPAAYLPGYKESGIRLKYF